MRISYAITVCNEFVEIQAQWASVRSRIRQKIGDAQFKSWIKLIKLTNLNTYKILSLKYTWVMEES